VINSGIYAVNSEILARTSRLDFPFKKRRLGGMLVGYARVSTLDQDTALQLDALRDAGVKQIYQDKGSGVGPRPQLRVALGKVQRGDTLVVWKLDRIARSLPDLLAIIARLNDHGASIKSLTEPIDTSNPVGRFTLQVLGAVAELERSIILERTAAGVAAARARGVRFGRSRALSSELECELVAAYVPGVVTMRDLALRFGVHESSVKRAIYRVYRPGHSSLK
jgi:DNA invertase Pin-like site-specific DNA recombinase